MLPSARAAKNTALMPKSGDLVASASQRKALRIVDRDCAVARTAIRSIREPRPAETVVERNTQGQADRRPVAGDSGRIFDAIQEVRTLGGIENDFTSKCTRLPTSCGESWRDNNEPVTHVNGQDRTRRFRRPGKRRAKIRTARDEKPRAIQNLSRLGKSRKIRSVMERTTFVESADLSNGSGAGNPSPHDICAYPRDADILPWQ